MKKALSVIWVLLIACLGTYAVGQSCDGLKLDLIGEGVRSVGTVSFSVDGDRLWVNFDITEDDACMMQDRLYVGTKPPDGDQDDFPLGRDMKACKKSDRFLVKIQPGSQLYLAAHSALHCCMYKEFDCNYLIGSLNECAAEYVQLDRSRDPASYLRKWIIGGGYALPDSAYPTGSPYYEGWCADPNAAIREYSGYGYDSLVYAACGPIPDGIVPLPENLDLVNWLMSHSGLIDTPAIDCAGDYTMPNFQDAIWQLLGYETGETTEEDACRVAELVLRANRNGEGFVPDCNRGQVAAVLLAPVEQHALSVSQPDGVCVPREDGALVGQPNLVGVPGCEIMCEEQTGWGLGGPNPTGIAGSWGQYFSCIASEQN